MSKLIRRLIVIAAVTTMAGMAGFTSASERPSPRIIGGSEISISEVPYTAALLRRQWVEFDGNLQSAQICAGVVIDPFWILTAAHCVVDADGRPDAPDSLMVLTGSSDLNAPNNQPIGVIRVVVHDEYVGFVEGRDIALLELESEALVPAVPLDAEPLVDGDPALIAGWGTILPPGSGYALPPSLMGAVVDMQPGDECADEYDLYAELTDETNICAARPGVDACAGDSGGPMYRITEEPFAAYSIAGITSWGIGCANPDAPGVYTNVSSYIDWIRQNTGSTTVTVVTEPPQVISPEPQPDPTAGPPSVGSLRASVYSSTALEIFWDRVNPSDWPIISYEIQRLNVGPGEPLVTELDALSYFDQGLSPGTSYYYQVRARDLLGRLGPISYITVSTRRY